VNILLCLRRVEEGESSSSFEGPGEESSSFSSSEHAGSEILACSQGSDYIPSGDDDRADESDVDVTGGSEEDESLRLLEKASNITGGAREGF